MLLTKKKRNKKTTNHTQGISHRSKTPFFSSSFIGRSSVTFFFLQADYGDNSRIIFFPLFFFPLCFLWREQRSQRHITNLSNFFSVCHTDTETTWKKSQPARSVSHVKLSGAYCCEYQMGTFLLKTGPGRKETSVPVRSCTLQFFFFLFKLNTTSTAL